MTGTPVVSAASRELSELVATFSGAGQVVGQYGRIKQQQDLEAKRRAAELERLNAKAEVFDRGEAAQQVAEAAPLWAEGIATGKIAVPTNPDEIPGWASDFASQHVDQNAPPAQQDEYLKRAKVHLIDLAARRALQDSDRATKDLAQAATNAALGTPDSAILQKSASALVALGYTEQDAAGMVGGAALDFAARNGNQASLDAAKSFLGNRFKEKQQAADAVFDAKQRQQEALDAQDSANSVYSQINDHLTDPISGPSWDRISDQITTESKSGVLPDHMANTLLNTVNSHKAAEQKLLDKAALVQEEADKKTAIMQGIGVAMDSAAQGVGNGAAMIPSEGVTFVLSDGTTKVHMTKDEIIRNQTAVAFQRINDQYKANPAQAFVEQVKYVANNGIDYEPWQAVMRGGPQAAMLATGGDDGKGQPVPIPQNAKDGWQLYNNISKVDHTLAMRLAGTNENAQFYETTRVAIKHVTNGNVDSGLLLAATAHRREAFRDTTAEQLDRNKAIAQTAEIAPGAKNAGDARIALGQLARLYMAIKGMDAKSAVDEAAVTLKGQYDVVGGYWVRTLNTTMPPKDAMENIVSFVKDEYLKSNPTLGLSRDQLAFVPDSGGDYWTLWNVPLNHPVDDPKTHGVYYNSDLMRAAHTMESRKKEDIIKIQALRNQPESWQQMLSGKYGGVAKQVPIGSYQP